MALFRFSANLCLAACVVAGWILFPFSYNSSAWADSNVGTLIITLNNPVMNGAPTDAYRTYFIRVSRIDGKDDAQIRYEQSWMVKSSNDLASSGGNGAVITKELSAGDWEVNTYEVDTHSPTVKLRPAKEFAIPFKIQPGRATYIGSFQPVGHMSKGLLDASIVGGARLVVTDRSARDVPIAQAKKPDLGPVDVSVYDVDTLNHPLLSSHDGVTTEPGDDQYCRWMNLLGCVAYP